MRGKRGEERSEKEGKRRGGEIRDWVNVVRDENGGGERGEEKKEEGTRRKGSRGEEEWGRGGEGKRKEG